MNFLNFSLAAIDVCTESSYKRCHDNASCTTVGPGKVNCSCLTGYHGDGYVCDPIDPCQVDNGGCDSNRSRCRYAGPGEVCYFYETQK